MTSSIFAPRSRRADCSPSTQRTASETLDLPQPFGPTIAVTPDSNVSATVSAKDLKPDSSSLDSFMPGGPGCVGGGSGGRRLAGRDDEERHAQRASALFRLLARGVGTEHDAVGISLAPWIEHRGGEARLGELSGEVARPLRIPRAAHLQEDALAGHRGVTGRGRVAGLGVRHIVRLGGRAEERPARGAPD